MKKKKKLRSAIGLSTPRSKFAYFKIHTLAATLVCFMLLISIISQPAAAAAGGNGQARGTGGKLKSADTAPPTITAPPDIVAEATGSLTIVSLGQPVVSDNKDPSPTVTNNAPSKGFPLGTISVTWTATDSSGNTASAIQKVTVQDTTPPSLVITKPTGYQSFERGKSITLEGTTSDYFGVKIVEAKLGAGPYQTATGTQSWTVDVPVPADFQLGGNTLTVIAIDTNGNAGYASESVNIIDIATNSTTTVITTPTTATTTPTSTNISTSEYHYTPAFAATGSNYYDIPDNAALRLHSFTLGAWFNTSMSVSGPSAIIAGKGGFGSENAGSNMNYGIWLDQNSNIVAGFEDSNGSNFFAHSKQQYNDSKWHYSVVTFDGQQLKLFVDGQAVASLSTTVAPDNTGTQPLRIGGNALQNDRYFNGLIDEVRVWNRPLASSEILAQYANGTFSLNGQLAYMNGTTYATYYSSSDTQPPTGSIAINSGALYASSTNVVLNLSCADSGTGCAQMRISIDGTFDTEVFEAFATSKPVILPAGDGVKIVKVVFKDGAGNISPIYSASITLSTTSTTTTTTSTATSTTQTSSIPFMYGVNKAPRPQSSVTTQAKIEKFIHDNGFGLLRVRVYWNDYYADPTGYTAKIKETADAADAAGLKVVYVMGMQVDLSPYFGSGFYGFPSAMVNSVIGPLSNYPTVKDAQTAFMRKYWDNSATFNGKSLWDNHADFALGVINGAGLANRASTLGYEIFNEPPLEYNTDYDKLSQSQTYIGNKILAVDGDAWIVANHPFQNLWKDTTKPAFWDITNTVKSLPKPSNGKVVYAPHVYTGSWITSTGQNDWNYIKGKISQIASTAKAPVIIGEWAIETSPAEFSSIATVLADAKALGWSLCWWSFDGGDMGHAMYTDNYDENPVKNWTANLQGMGRTSTVGSPK